MVNDCEYGCNHEQICENLDLNTTGKIRNFKVGLEMHCSLHDVKCMEDDAGAIKPVFPLKWCISEGCYVKIKDGDFLLTMYQGSDEGLLISSGEKLEVIDTFPELEPSMCLVRTVMTDVRVQFRIDTSRLERVGV
jgi:hypothetical protein